jgi:rubredoxin
MAYKPPPGSFELPAERGYPERDECLGIMSDWIKSAPHFLAAAQIATIGNIIHCVTPPMSAPAETVVAYRKFMCVVCGFIYDEEAGLPEEGIQPGTRWEDIPDTWTCPDCGVTKDDFEMIEIEG